MIFIRHVGFGFVETKLNEWQVAGNCDEGRTCLRVETLSLGVWKHTNCVLDAAASQCQGRQPADASDGLEGEMAAALAAALAPASTLHEAGAQLQPEQAAPLLCRLQATAQLSSERPALGAAVLHAGALARTAAVVAQPTGPASPAAAVAVSVASELQQWCVGAARESLLELQGSLLQVSSEGSTRKSLTPCPLYLPSALNSNSQMMQRSH